MWLLVVFLWFDVGYTGAVCRFDNISERKAKWYLIHDDSEIFDTEHFREGRVTFGNKFPCPPHF